MSIDMWLPTADFLPRSSLPHVLCGLDDAVAAVVDDFDAVDADWPVVEIDPAALLPTQEIIDAGNLAALAFAVAAQSLPPIHVVAVAATRELRILDGSPRLLGRPAWRAGAGLGCGSLRRDHAHHLRKARNSR